MMNKPIVLTVSQLTHAIKLNLENAFPSVWLQGEVSNCKLQSSGHLYFSLKDPQAQISAVMFRGDAALLKAIPKDGDHVMIRGEINVYPPSGKYQIVARELQHVGLGALLLKLEELKAKLQQRGWFSPEHKKPLPKFPRRIGVVTSPTGAVIQDIINVLSRRFAGFHLILNPVKVQGEGAAQEIAQAIQQFNAFHLADVLIVGRGGGSIEDLWAFNEEIVAEAIFKSQIPIISAVGHETDYCIADFVADVRAPTPSAAAEIVIAEKAHHLHFLEQTRGRLQHSLLHQIKNYRRHLDAIRKQPVFQSPYALLGPRIQRLDVIRDGLDNSIKQYLAHCRLRLQGQQRHVAALNPITQMHHFRHKIQRLDQALRHTIQIKLRNAKQHLQQKNLRQFLQAWQRFFSLRKERLQQLTLALNAINPKNVLQKGYCIPFAEKDRSVITSVNAVNLHDEIRLLLADGELLSIVKERIPK